MKFSSVEEYEQTAKKVLEDATALIRKNKGINVYLDNDYETRVSYSNGYLFSYSLIWPKNKDHHMSLHSNFFFDGFEPTNLPLIEGQIKAGLIKLLGVVTDLEYITACVTTWIYLVGKEYKYF